MIRDCIYNDLAPEYQHSLTELAVDYDTSIMNLTEVIKN